MRKLACYRSRTAQYIGPDGRTVVIEFSANDLKPEFHLTSFISLLMYIVVNRRSYFTEVFLAFPPGCPFRLFLSFDTVSNT